MKTVKFLNILSIVTIIGLLFVGCKKDKTEKDFDSSSMQQLTQDEVAIENYSNEALDDANEVLTKGAFKSISLLPCNALIDSIVSGDTMIYTITFNGYNCSNTKYKTGKIIFKRNITTPWTQAGTAVSVHFVDYKVAKAINLQKWIMLNGYKLWTNVSGGKIKNLGNGTTTAVVHSIVGSIQASFSDTTNRIWNINRKKTFSGVYPGAIILTIEGMGSANGFNNLATWGLNRHNENFYTQINQPIVLKQACGWNPVSGIKVHQIPADNKSATVTFGFDNNNQPVTNGNCPDKYKVDWVKGSYSGTFYNSL